MSINVAVKRVEFEVTVVHEGQTYVRSHALVSDTDLTEQQVEQAADTVINSIAADIRRQRGG